MSELLEKLNQLVQLSQAAPTQIDSLKSALQQLEYSTLSLAEVAQQLQSAAQTGCAGVTDRLQATASLLEQRRQSLGQAQQTSLRSLQSLIQTNQQQEQILSEELTHTRGALSSLLACGNGAMAEFQALSTAQLAAVAANLQSLQAGWQELEHNFSAVQSSLKSFSQVQRQVQAQQKSAMTAWSEQFSTTRGNLGKEALKLGDQSRELNSQFSRAMEELLNDFTQRAQQIERSQAEALETLVTRPCDSGVKAFCQEAVLYMGQQSALAEDKLLPLGSEFEKQVKRSQQGTPLKAMLVTTYYFLQKLGQDSLLSPYLELLFRNG
ncbi:MAG: hypothetical protein U0931_28420 [Vulcanimicrobiota bacterium]